MHHGHRRQCVGCIRNRGRLELSYDADEAGSIYPTMQELRAAAAKQADTCVAGVAWCGMWRVQGVSPYVGIRIGGIGWNHEWRIVDWLKNDKKNY